MKISNVTILSTDLANNTAKISFTISEATENVNIYLKINNEEYKVIFLNKTNGNLEYTTKVSRGVNNLLLKATDSTTEYISEPIQVLLKEAPSIENLECSYSDSTGKYILNFAFNGDTNFKYNIYLKLDINDYIEVLSNQISGDKIIEQTSTMGEHTCILKVSDGYDDYTFPSFQFEITNRKPILSKVLVTDITNDGEAYIYYATKDIESSTLTHKLTIGTTETVITPTQVDNFYSYKITGLPEGISNCTISISDDIDTVSSDVFSIEVFPKATDKKESLRRAKVRYDSAYQQLRDIIVSVVSDLKYDYDIENALIAKAQDNYKIEYSNFNKISQQSIDIIGSNKVTISKQELQSEISDVDNAVNSLENTMWGVFQDGILDQSEREALNSSLDLVAKEKSDIDRDYETLYNNEDLTDPSKTKLQTSYNNFITAHNSLVTTIDDIINKAGIVDNTDKSRMDSAFENWRTALGDYRVASLEAIDSIAKKKADNSADTVDKKWADIVLDPKTGIKSQVGSLQSKITGTGGIEERLKTAEQTLTPDGIATIVKDKIYTKAEADEQMSSIQQSINGINGEISSLNTTVNNNKTSVDSQMSSIQEAMEGIDASFDELINTVDNIQIGARNYLRNSNFKNQKENWSASHGGTLNITGSNDNISLSCPFKNGKVAEVVQKFGQNEGYITQDSNGLFELEVGAIYTFSGFIYADTTIPIAKVQVGKFDIVNGSWVNGATKKINERGNWIKFEYTFTASNARVAIIVGVGGTSSTSSYTIYGTGFKLEKGNKATDWTPAPEDTDSAINTVNKHVTEKMSSFQQTVDSINSEISSIEITIDNNNKNVTSQMSSIQQTVEGIDGKFSSLKVTVDDNKKSVDSQMASFQQSLNGFSNEVSSVKKTVNDNKTSVDSKMSSFQQTINGFSSEVSSLQTTVDNNNRNMISKMSSLQQTVDGIDLSVQKKVDGNKIISAINMSPESIKINSSKVNITGFVTFSDLSNSGSTTINGDNITSGTIRGREIISTESDNKARVSMWQDGLRFYSPTMQAGKICYDSNGEGTEESAKDRFLIESWNGYVLKLLSSGDISISAKNYSELNDVFIEANRTKIDNYTNTTYLTSETFSTANRDIYMSYDFNYFPQINTWKSAPCITIADVSLKAASSLHLTTADGGSPATLFCENTNFGMFTSLAEPVSISSMSELTATDKINNLQINNTNNGYRIVWDNSIATLSAESETKDTPTDAMVTTEISKDGAYIISNVDTFTTISTLCKSVQELSARISELENKLNK